MMIEIERIDSTRVAREVIADGADAAHILCLRFTANDGRQYRVDLAQDGSGLEVSSGMDSLAVMPIASNRVLLYQAYAATRPVAHITGVGFIGDSPETHQARVNEAHRKNETTRRGRSSPITTEGEKGGTVVASEEVRGG